MGEVHPAGSLKARALRDERLNLKAKVADLTDQLMHARAHIVNLEELLNKERRSSALARSYATHLIPQVETLLGMLRAARDGRPGG